MIGLYRICIEGLLRDDKVRDEQLVYPKLLLGLLYLRFDGRFVIGDNGHLCLHIDLLTYLLLRVIINDCTDEFILLTVGFLLYAFESLLHVLMLDAV